MDFMSTLQSPFQKFASPSEGMAEGRSAMRESQSMLLWITVLGFVLHHHPNDVDHVSPQADEGLRF